MFKKIAIALSVPLLIIGCASVPMEPAEVSESYKQFNDPDEGKAGLYVYRDSPLGTALKKDIWVNGDCLGESAIKVFFYTQVPGNMDTTIHTESEFSPNSMSLFTEEGKNYFIRQYIKLGVFVGGADLEEIEAEKAKESISKLNMATPGHCSGELKSNEEIAK